MSENKSNTNVQYLAKGINILKKPEDGESISVFPRPNDKISFDFDTSKAQYKLVGSDIVVKMPNGGEIVFVSMTTLAYENNPPKIVLPTGQILHLDDLLLQIDEIKESEVSSVITDDMVKLEEELEKVKAQVQEETKNLEEAKKQTKIEQETQKQIEQQNRYEQEASLSKTEGDKNTKSKEIEEQESISEEDFTSNEVAPINDFNAFKEPAEDSTKNEDNISEVTAVVDFEVGLYQTQAVVSEKDSSIVVDGGGGSVRARHDSSGEAQIQSETLDYSKSVKALSVNLDNEAWFGKTEISKLIAINATQPPGFEFSTITLKDIPAGYSIVNGEKNADGSWTIQRGTTAQELADDPTLESKDGFLVTNDGIELVLKYNPNATTKEFTMSIDAESTFDLKNYKIDPSDPNYKELDTPKELTMYGSSSIGIQLKDINEVSDYTYTGSEDAGFVLSTVRNDNIIFTSHGDSTIVGSYVQDTITAYEGDDILKGGEGDDTFKAGEGDDTIIGGTGIDVIDYSNASLEINLNLLTGVSEGEGNDTLTGIENAIGSSFNDTLKGNDEINIIEGRDGHDTLKGADGDDTLIGGIGDDTLMGGFGDDLLQGSSGNDTASYLESANAITAYLTDPTVGSGDTPYGTVLGEGKDRLESIENVDGSYFDDTIFGDKNDNTLFGDKGDDLIIGDKGNDALDGGEGFDTVDFSGVDSNGVEVDLEYKYAQGDGLDVIENIEKVIGTKFDDNLRGDLLDNVLDGNIGDDTLYGNDGDDTLYGNIGDDTLRGGEGDDYIDGGLNTAYGDMVSYKDAVNKVEVDLQQNRATGEGIDTLVGIENIEGSTFSDTLAGDSDKNKIYGLAGDDTIVASGNDDYIDGGSGIDTIDFTNIQNVVELNLQDKVADSDGHDTLKSIENAIGSLNSDTLIGSSDVTVQNGGRFLLYNLTIKNGSLHLHQSLSQKQG